MLFRSRNEANEKTARYSEYGNKGAGAAIDKRVKWSKQLSSKEAAQYNPENIFRDIGNWYPYK